MCINYESSYIHYYSHGFSPPPIYMGGPKNFELKIMGGPLLYFLKMGGPGLMGGPPTLWGDLHSCCTHIILFCTISGLVPSSEVEDLYLYIVRLQTQYYLHLSFFGELLVICTPYYTQIRKNLSRPQIIYSSLIYCKGEHKLV